LLQTPTNSTSKKARSSKLPRPPSWVPSRRAASPRQPRLTAEGYERTLVTNPISGAPKLFSTVYILRRASPPRWPKPAKPPPYSARRGVFKCALCSTACVLPAGHRLSCDLRVGIRTPSAASVFCAVHRAFERHARSLPLRGAVRGSHPQRAEAPSAKAQATMTRITQPLTGSWAHVLSSSAHLSTRSLPPKRFDSHLPRG
jgi:hypothetical protein